MLSLSTAMDLFRDCRTPVDCLYLLGCTNSAAWQPTELVLIARACVFRMYNTNLLTVNCLKTMFLFDTHTPDITFTGSSLEDGMRTWIEKVGPSSSYWCTISFFTRVSEIYKTPLDNCKDQFKFGSCLDEDTNGVMEILFAASCFMSPRLVNMGSLFWVFTREIIRVNVSSVDQLNSLLWNQLLPQTILALEPIVYSLDCLLPGIDIVLSIEGIPPHGKLAPSTDKKRPVIMIPSNSSLVFYNNARLSCLDIQRIEVPHAQRQDNALTFKAVRGDRREVRLADICVTGGGIRIEKYDFVRCACISVTGATVGLTIRNVRDFYFGGGRRSSHGHFIDPKIEQCGIAIAIKPACRVICEEVSVSDCGTVFSVSVSDDFLVKRATLQRCGSMGEVFMTPGLRPVFFETMFGDFSLGLAQEGTDGGFIATKAIYRSCGPIISGTVEER